MTGPATDGCAMPLGGVVPAPRIVGIAGPSGTGKTTVAHAIAAAAPGRVVVLSLDDYFRDPASFPIIDGEPDWDEPENLRFDLLARHLRALKAGRAVIAPVLDKRTLERGDRAVAPCPLILAEGFLLFHDPGVRDLLDLRIYLDLPEPEQIRRRLVREGTERRAYVEACVVPHYRAFGLPTKRFADLVIDAGGTADEVTRRVKEAIEEAGDVARSRTVPSSGVV